MFRVIVVLSLLPSSHQVDLQDEDEKLICKITPLDQTAGETHIVTGHDILLTYGEGNRRIMTFEGFGGVMSDVKCTGVMDDSCKEGKEVSQVEECPSCPCDQDTSESQPLTFGVFQRFWDDVSTVCSQSPPPRLLHIGLGLSAMVTYVAKNCVQSYNSIIEIDPRLVYLSKTYLGGTWNETRAMSCEQGIADIRKDVNVKYDRILLDAYDNKNRLAEPCSDEAFAQQVKDLLTDKGCLLVCLWNPEWGENFTKVFGATGVDLNNNAYRWCKGDKVTGVAMVDIIEQAPVRVSSTPQEEGRQLDPEQTTLRFKQVLHVKGFLGSA